MSTKEQHAWAMVFQDTKLPFVVKPIQWPELKTGEVLVEIKYSTICTSDLHTFFGRRGGPRPSILGHEIIGEIVAVAAEGVNDYFGDTLQVGDMVTWTVYAHKHEGKMAQKGFPQKSEGLFKYGHEKLAGNYKLNGGFASHCHLKGGTDIFKLPAGLSPKVAAPINCTHATIAGAFRLAGKVEGKNVLVSGVGMLGLSACAMAKEAGAKNVWAMDIDQKRLERSLEFGVNSGLNAKLSVDEIAVFLKEEGGVDVIFETSGVPSAMEKGIQLLNIGGTSIWVGAVYTQRPLNIDAEKIVRNILTIKGLHNYVPEDLAVAVQFISENQDRYPFEKLVGCEFPLDKLDRAFETANEKSYYRVGIYPV